MSDSPITDIFLKSLTEEDIRKLHDIIGKKLNPQPIKTQEKSIIKLESNLSEYDEQSHKKLIGILDDIDVKTECSRPLSIKINLPITFKYIWKIENGEIEPEINWEEYDLATGKVIKEVKNKKIGAKFIIILKNLQKKLEKEIRLVARKHNLSYLTLAKIYGDGYIKGR